HRRAVFTFKEDKMLVASTSVVGFGFGSGEAQHGPMFSGLHPKRTSELRAEYMLFPPQALRKRRHRGLAQSDRILARQYAGGGSVTTQDQFSKKSRYERSTRQRTRSVGGVFVTEFVPKCPRRMCGIVGQFFGFENFRLRVAATMRAQLENW